MLCALPYFKDPFANSNNAINDEEPGQQGRASRRHLPLPTGPHTVGCVDLMCEMAEDGTFYRLYYPTNKADLVSYLAQNFFYSFILSTLIIQQHLDNLMVHSRLVPLFRTHTMLAPVEAMVVVTQ